VGMLHTQTGGDGCGGSGIWGIDRALGWLHLQAEGGGEVRILYVPYGTLRAIWHVKARDSLATD
jgi:hypothetical protein